MMLVIAIVATILALVQNSIVFAFGMKEGAIYSFPLSFLGIFLLELASIWTAYFWVRHAVRRKRELVLLACTLFILVAAEVALPAGYFTTLVRQALRAHALQRIRQVGASIEPLTSDTGGVRFALTYQLSFPAAGHYLTFPAYLGQPGKEAFGSYFTKVHPEYYDEDYVFAAGTPYSFTVVFDTRGKTFDFSQEKANIQICDGKDYFMACRTIPIGLDGVPRALAVPAPPGKLEPEVPAGNIRDLTEKSLRLTGLAVSDTNRSGQPIAIFYAITNAGKTEIPIPKENLGNVIAINYAWEPVSSSARNSKVIPGTMHFGNAVAAGTAFLGSIKKGSLAPGEGIAFSDLVKPFEPLAPGDYRLRVFLFSVYATDRNKPEQELVQPFSVTP